MGVIENIGRELATLESPGGEASAYADIEAQDDKDTAQDRRITELMAASKVQLAAILDLQARIDVLEAHKNAMAEAANALQAESSPRIPYTVSVLPFEADPAFDLHEGPR